jgi:hypothetical protein
LGLDQRLLEQQGRLPGADERAATHIGAEHMREDAAENGDRNQARERERADETNPWPQDGTER